MMSFDDNLDNEAKHSRQYNAQLRTLPAISTLRKLACIVKSHEKVK